jgi:hypothetical protein
VAETHHPEDQGRFAPIHLAAILSLRTDNLFLISGRSDDGATGARREQPE